MKNKIGLIILSIFILFMVCMMLFPIKAKETYKPKTIQKYHHSVKLSTHFIDEDFILIERQEYSSSHNKEHNSTIVRLWLIQRVNNPTQYAQITSEVDDYNNQSCGCNGFVITPELWYNKKVGDKLHFKYINKKRFFIKQ